MNLNKMLLKIARSYHAKSLRDKKLCRFEKLQQDVEVKEQVLNLKEDLSYLKEMIESNKVILVSNDTEDLMKFELLKHMLEIED